MQISENLDFRPENYLLGFDAGRSIKSQSWGPSRVLTSSYIFQFFKLYVM
jgi:hypothetical protein